MTVYTLMPIHESLGLAVIGIDLGQPIDAETGEHLARLLAQHLVLVFPCQSLTPEQYLAAASTFGPPTQQDSQHQMPGYPDIGLVWRRNSERRAETWHSDLTNRECPPAATVLYGVEIPASGGGTSIADMRAAYWALPEEERRHLETLRTVNACDPELAGTGPEDLAHGVAVSHPMLRTHPISRERSVYFQPTKTTYIEGMTLQASQEYLADLVERLICPEIVYQHRWIKGDVLVIDDRATLRRADNDYGRRENLVLWRIMVEGDRPTLP